MKKRDNSRNQGQDSDAIYDEKKLMVNDKRSMVNGQWSMKKEVPYKRKRLHSKHCLTIYLIIMPLWMMLLTLMIYFDSNNIYKLTKKQPDTWIQLNSGATILARAKEPWFRSDETIIELVKPWAIASLSWSGKLADGSKDNGVIIGDKKITLTAWSASTLLNAKFQPFWRKKLAEMTPVEVFQGISSSTDNSYQAKIESVFYLENEEKLKPIMIQKGYWQIDLIGHISLINLNDMVGENIPINQRIILKAIPYLSIDPNQKLTDTQLAAYRWRTKGLEIIKIQELPHGSARN